jgi:predicted MPP superfamily phosphohydrolase/multidrug transporter EmrE-like cation transporter
MHNQTGFLITLLVFALLEYYSFVALNVSMRSYPLGVRYTVFGVYSLVSIIVWICLFTFRSWSFSESHPSLRIFLICFVMGFLAAKVLVAVFMILDDLRRLITWCIRYLTAFFPQTPKDPVEIPNGISRSTFLARMAILAGGLLLGGFLYGPKNRYRYVIKRHRIKLKNLPDAFQGLKIVHISDIHAGSFDNVEAVAHGVDLILKEQADMIVFTGDLVNNAATEIEPYIDVFSKLKAPMGVYSTLGNHDYGDYIQWPSATAKAENLELLKAHHARMGWRLLMNEHIIFERSSQKLALIGVENWSNLARFPKHGDLAKAYSGLEHEPVSAKILLSHDPTHWDAQIRKEFADIDLTLSGHTHGMQFGLRLPWMKWSPVQYIYNQWAGLYQEGSQYINVNVGYGFLGYPGRLGILPEITVIELE